MIVSCSLRAGETETAKGGESGQRDVFIRERDWQLLTVPEVTVSDKALVLFAWHAPRTRLDWGLAAALVLPGISQCGWPELN